MDIFEWYPTLKNYAELKWSTNKVLLMFYAKFGLLEND